MELLYTSLSAKKTAATKIIKVNESPEYLKVTEVKEMIQEKKEPK